MLANWTLRSQCTLAVLAASLAYAQEGMPSGRLINSRAVAFNPSNGKVYVVDQPHASVSIIDSRNGSSLSVKVGAGPDAIAINATTGRVYVANSSDGTVSELDGITNSVTATFKAGSHPYTLAVNEATNKVYVSNTFSNAVAEIDVPSKTTHFLKIGSADNITVDSRANRVFFIGYEDPNVRIMSGLTGQISKAPAIEHLWGMATDESSGDILVTESGSGQILLVDPASGQQSKIAVGAIPCAIAVNTQTKTVYAVNYGDNSVTAIQANKAIATIKVGDGPQAIAVDSKANRIYVANTHSDSVTVIDGQTNTAIATVPAGKNPYAITAGSDPRTVYVANFGEPSFTAVSVSEK